MKYFICILTAVFIQASAISVFAQEDNANSPTFGDGVAEYSLQNYEKAAQIWKYLADNGSSDAAYRLAQLYEMGLGVEYSPTETVRYLLMAVAGERVEAQYMLANIYASGRGVEAEPQTAMILYEQAANQGHGRAMYQLASMLYVGDYVEQDLLMAAFWFYRAKDVLHEGQEKQLSLQVYNLIFEQLSDDDQLKLLQKIAKR